MKIQQRILWLLEAMIKHIENKAVEGEVVEEDPSAGSTGSPQASSGQRKKEEGYILSVYYVYISLGKPRLFKIWT